MASTSYQEIRDSLRQLYLDDPRPWLVGFSGGKDGSMVASLLFEAVLAVPVAQRKKEIGHWGEAILHWGARRAESSTHAETMASRDTAHVFAISGSVYAN